MTAPARRPGSRYEAELLRVVCPQDGGGSPFGWGDGSEPTPAAPSGGTVRALSVPEPVRGPSGRWTAEIASDGHAGPRGVAPGRPEIGRGDASFTGYLSGTAGNAPAPEPPSRPATGAQSAELPSGGLPEPDGAERQTGAQRGRSTNSSPNTPAGDQR